MSRSTGCTYYVNAATGKSQFEHPGFENPRGGGSGAALLKLDLKKMCEGCGLKQPGYGLASEGKKRWCAGCGKAEGAVNIQVLRKRQDSQAGPRQTAAAVHVLSAAEQKLSAKKLKTFEQHAAASTFARQAGNFLCPGASLSIHEGLHNKVLSFPTGAEAQRATEAGERNGVPEQGCECKQSVCRCQQPADFGRPVIGVAAFQQRLAEMWPSDAAAPQCSSFSSLRPQFETAAAQQFQATEGAQLVGGPPSSAPACAASPRPGAPLDTQSETQTACMYCGVGPGQCDAEETAAEITANKRTRKRRRKKEGVGRKEHRMGKWWSGYGYAGDPYCQRCGEVFRDHLIRQRSNSAGCSREQPCDDCDKILHHFPLTKPEIWQRVDAKAKAKHPKGKHPKGKHPSDPPEQTAWQAASFKGLRIV
jgi:hypothetical protein